MELMVGMAVGLLIVAAATSVYITSLRGGNDALRSAKLNIELRGAMDLMTSEIRRAGYWPANGASLTGNPFTQATTNIKDIGNNCIVFSYDKNSNGTSDTASDTTDFLGFRLGSQDIDMRISGTNTSDCTSGSWESLTDSRTVIIDTLTFNITYQCLNSKTNLSAIQQCASGQSLYDTAATATGKTDLVELRQVTINLTAHHVSDPLTRIQLSQVVYLRNSRIQTVGI